MSAVILTPADSRIVLLRSAAGYRVVRPSGYVLPVATSSVLGGVKVGSGLSITDGTLSATGGVWGSITGTLSNQSDLNAALSARALTSGTLGQFAATTSAELAGVLTDETGSGSAVFATNPTFVTQITTPRLVTSAAGSIAGAAIGWTLSGGNHGWYVFGSGTPTTAFIGVVSNSNLHTAIRANLTSYTGGTNVGWVSGSDPTVGQVLGLARLDDNTIEINNGTRTASGGALRGLSVSSLTASGTVTVSGGLVDLASVANPWPIPTNQSGLRRFGTFTEVWNNNSFAANRAGSCWIIGSAMRFGVSPDSTAGAQFGVTAEDTSLSRSSAGVWQMGTTANNALGSLLLTNLTASGLIGLGTYTVATLPSASANAGRLAQVTDSNSTTNGSTVAGGGANRVPVFSNGTNWIIK